VTTAEARRLKPGTPVTWTPDGTRGTFVDSHEGVGIVAWEDGWPVRVSLWSDGADWWADVERVVEAPRQSPTLAPAQRSSESFRQRVPDALAAKATG